MLKQVCGLSVHTPHSFPCTFSLVICCQGAIILGTGGDNSNRAEGNFYEGYIATGVTSAETDNAIQANIVAVGYNTL